MPTATLDAPADNLDHPDFCKPKFCTAHLPWTPDDGHGHHSSELHAWLIEGHWLGIRTTQVPTQTVKFALTVDGLTAYLEPAQAADVAEVITGLLRQAAAETVTSA